MSPASIFTILGRDGSLPEDILIDSLQRAYEDDNGAIALSLVSAGGWTKPVSGVVASRVVG